jgi:choline monooxygenase
MTASARIATEDWLQAQPSGTALALPAHCYLGEAALERDRRAVLARGWQLVAHEHLLAGPGDHAVAEIAGVSLVLVVDEAGTLRALHNVCRHRAGPLASCAGRGLQRLTCQYHGWTYALDGALLGAPGMGRAPGFDASQVRLPHARVARWQGLVFACLDEAAPDFVEVVDGLDALLAGAGLASMRFARRVVYEVACDWKVYVDNYLEGYHVARVHPGLGALLDARAYATTLARWHSVQASPIASDAGLYGAGQAVYAFVWPNTMINALPGRLQTNRVLPAGPGRCTVVFDYAYPQGQGEGRAPGEGDEAGRAAAAARVEADLAFSDTVQAEDAAICEAVQRGLASGSWTPGRLNPFEERGVWHFHELLREAWREGRA